MIMEHLVSIYGFLVANWAELVLVYVLGYVIEAGRMLKTLLLDDDPLLTTALALGAALLYPLYLPFYLSYLFWKIRV
jgi:hypothetical protein